MSGTRATLRNTGTALSRTINDDRHGYFGPKVAKVSEVETPAETPSETPDESMPADDSTAPAETTPETDSAQPATAETTPQTDSAQLAATEKPAETPVATEKPEEAVPQPDVESDLYVGGFGSFHTYGVNFLFGDGAVHFVHNDIDMKVLQQLGNRADGKLLEGGPTRKQ